MNDKEHDDDHIERLLDYTPTISKHGSTVAISFDEPEQAADFHDVLMAEIKSRVGEREEEE